MRLVTTKYQLICNTLFVIFWVMVTYNFITQELAGQEVRLIETSVRLIAQGLIVLLGLWTLRSKTDIIILATFLILSFVSTCLINKLSIFMWFDGMRLYIGFLFTLPILRYLISDTQFRGWFVERMDRNLYRFLWIQIPCILLQLKYPHPDYCGGSLGWMQSGTVSNMIYLISFYLMLRAWDNEKGYLANVYKNWVLIFLLFPTFLNETKISFVFLIMYFFFLIPMNRQFIKNMIYVVPIMVVGVGGALYLYTTVIGDNDNITDSASTATYLLGDDSAINLVEAYVENKSLDYETDLARGLKFFITPAIMNRHPVSWFVGYGIGNYKINEAAKGVKFAKEYQWLLRGTMIEGHLIWLELGLIGLGLYYVYWFVVMKAFRRGQGRKLQLQWFLGINAVIISVYNASFNEVGFYLVFIYMIVASSSWNTLPKYADIKLLGKRQIKWSMRSDAEA
ncbi:MAG: hypothetical protein NC217_07230 [Muribaculaceae bacterium]|nr:hypothetical protein [Muribaculaceae bacterium]